MLPARAEILTGEFAQHNGAHSNGGLFCGYPALIDKGNTLGVWLQEAGYDTSLFGRFLNGYDPSTYAVPPGWDQWHAFVNHGGGYCDFTMTDGTSVEHHDNDGFDSTDQIANDTVARIGQTAQAGGPFFIWSSYFAPHGLRRVQLRRPAVDLACERLPGCGEPVPGTSRRSTSATSRTSRASSRPGPGAAVCQQDFGLLPTVPR